jgi:hypothetical protein
MYFSRFIDYPENRTVRTYSVNTGKSAFAARTTSSSKFAIEIYLYFHQFALLLDALDKVAS